MVCTEYSLDAWKWVLGFSFNKVPCPHYLIILVFSIKEASSSHIVFHYYFSTTVFQEIRPCWINHNWIFWSLVWTHIEETIQGLI